jgi:hypothetical protein
LWLRRSAKLVFELTYKEIDLSFSAPASIAVPMFEKEYEVIALAINLVELTRRKLGPLIVEFGPEVFPFRSENVFIHYDYL